MHNDNVIVEYIALKEARMPEKSELKETLNEMGIDMKDVMNLKITDETISFNYKDSKSFCVIQLMKVAIPWSNLEGPCSAAWYWNTATQKMKEHQAHFVVGLSRTDVDLVENYFDLTRIVGALATVSDTVGIYRPSGAAVFPEKMFIEEVKKSGEDSYPLALWVNFQVGKHGDGYVLYTIGMKTFGYKEIEIQSPHNSPDKMYNLAYNLAHYILEDEREIEDGHTFGMSEDEKIKVNFKDSMWDRSGEVMAISY